MNQNDLQELSFLFAVRIINLYKHLVTQKKEYVWSKQLLRSGTSIGANIVEAKHGSSRADFLHKLTIAKKEAAETVYWLALLFQTDYLTQPEYLSISREAESILNMLKSSVLTTQKNSNGSKS
jgi:four helix bundle protein